MSKINSAESIRGLACLAVVFSHFSLTYLPELHNFDNLTGIGNSFTNWLYHSPFAFFLFRHISSLYLFCFKWLCLKLRYFIKRFSKALLHKDFITI